MARTAKYNKEIEITDEKDIVICDRLNELIDSGNGEVNEENTELLLSLLKINDYDSIEYDPAVGSYFVYTTDFTYTVILDEIALDNGNYVVTRQQMNQED